MCLGAATSGQRLIEDIDIGFDFGIQGFRLIGDYDATGGGRRFDIWWRSLGIGAVGRNSGTTSALLTGGRLPWIADSAGQYQ